MTKRQRLTIELEILKDREKEIYKLLQTWQVDVEETIWKEEDINAYGIKIGAIRPKKGPIKKEIYNDKKTKKR